MFGVNLHYSIMKPKPGSFDGATIILSDSNDATNNAGHVLVRHAAMVRTLLFGSAAGPGVAEPCTSSPVVLLDLEPLRFEAESKELTWELLLEGEGATRDQLNKAIGKPVVRALNKLMMGSTGATLVACGRLCPLAIKLLRTTDPHGAAAAEKFGRVVLLDPELPRATVNALLTGGFTPASSCISVEVAFPSAAVRDRRLPVLRTVLPRGCDALLLANQTEHPVVNSQSGDDLGAALLGALVNACAVDINGPEAEVPSPPFCEDEFDGLGKRLYLSEIEVKMGPDKQYVISAVEITHGVIELARNTSDRRPLSAETDDTLRAGPGENEVTHGALVLRGNRCILSRSLETPPLWHGMRLPVATASGSEKPVDTARRAVAEMCDVDCLDGDDDEFVHLTAVPPVPLYTSRGHGNFPKLTLVHLFYAVNPPPPGPLEDADMEDDEDAYDWYKCYVIVSLV
jgi:hypothetical protein